MEKVRVRFAPSPTGPLHIGGVRTALYNYLFAKKHGGDFLLRIEDTDQTRFVPGAEEYIIEALNWCGLNYDEGPVKGGAFGPYRQSERKEMYRQYADYLVNNGFAYYAFDTPEELDEMRERLKAAGMATPQYNAITRSSMKNALSLSEDEVKKRLDAGESYVIRIKIPRNEEVKFKDEIRGWVVVHTSNMDDKVLFKSDGMPTYHLANIVDDYLMKITHVIRGEEWLPSAPLHVLLYRYLGWEDKMPAFAHLPLILKPDGNGKLSKRDGDRLGFPVFPLEWKDPFSDEISSGYRERGYFPDAFINLMAMLGWNPGTEKEIFSMQELIESFNLERVGKSGAKFDADKAKWFNQHYLRNKSDAELANLLAPHLTQAGISPNVAFDSMVCSQMKERSTFISDMLEGMYFYKAPTDYDKEVISKKWKENSTALMRELAERIQAMSDFDAEKMEDLFKKFLEEKSLSFGALLPIFRVLITGKAAGPSLFQICGILGKQESLNRIETGLKTIAG
jgi:glutamyl-tRNA synthetase